METNGEISPESCDKHYRIHTKTSGKGVVRLEVRKGERGELVERMLSKYKTRRDKNETRRDKNRRRVRTFWKDLIGLRRVSMMSFDFSIKGMIYL
jgi:hypothetical protein